MPIRHEMQVHNQVDTLHVLSRAEQSKKTPEKEEKGSLKILLCESVLFLVMAVCGGILLGYSLSHSMPGQFFLSVILLVIAAVSLFWLIPTFRAWQKQRSGKR